MSNQRSSHNRVNLQPSDSCGVGLVASIQNEPQHRVLQLALRALANVAHRGAIAADGKTGDGCGIMSDLPQPLVRQWVSDISEGVESELVGVGALFLPLESKQRDRARQFISGTLKSIGLRIIGFRDVPFNKSVLGEQAFKQRPGIEQVFVTGPTDDPDELERRLFIARRTIEHSPMFAQFESLHIASFSCRKIVYKAMVLSDALADFYLDLQDPLFQCSVSIYHQRFSTNTAPKWSLCQPFRTLAHNGEINTIQGNRNWMTARESSFDHEFWQEYRSVVQRLFNAKDSDSASLDNSIELLNLSGRSIPHALNMLIPPAWENDPRLTDPQKAFYNYHSCFCEPWDGPAAVVAFDGNVATATLDRNGLRPLRFKVTHDDLFIAGSEAGADRDSLANIKLAGRLGPGQSLAVDLQQKQILFDEQIKNQLASEYPYATWLAENQKEFHVDPETEFKYTLDQQNLLRQQVAAGVTKEELNDGIVVAARNAQEPTFSMGVDTPLAMLSRHPRHLGDFFKQRFAQVTNPPIDPIRERSGMSMSTGLGPERNLLETTPNHCRVVTLENPILDPTEYQQLREQLEFPSIELDCTWNLDDGPAGLELALDRLVAESRLAVDQQNVVLFLCDKNVNANRVAIPMLLAVGAIHHGLNKTGQRMMCSLVANTSEVRNSHHLALLFGFGCTAVCPWVGFASLQEQWKNERFVDLSLRQTWENYRKALSKGVLKIMSKMGISVLYSYQGAQIFETVGLGRSVIDKCFKSTYSNLGGIGFETIAQRCLQRHENAFRSEDDVEPKLVDLGIFKAKRNGELHVINGKVTKNLHQFVRNGNNEDYSNYLGSVNHDQSVTIRDLMSFHSDRRPIDLSEVEPIETIRSRFTTAAMSLGAISPEAHEALAIAMNEIGGKSNSGEGGEDPRRFNRLPNGTWANSKIKQVASGRFGVNPRYLLSASEIEIKMAQGAKPGEGGQLPGFKVNGLIARLRNTAPGVTLISPPPHHDIYSIEDLAQLIHDLKMVNPDAKVCVKLVAKTGVGGIAMGVAKAFADVVLISGHEGGTGASPKTSIQHAGLPWEIGLSETHQNLVAGNLRDRVIVRVDGGLRTGMDIIKAAILGAEEYNFGTMALIALGCVYVKKCHLNNCPVGIATQDEKYRAKFKGKPENVIEYLNAVANECRQHLSELGYRSIDELIGRFDLLQAKPLVSEKGFDLRRILPTPDGLDHKTTQQKYESPGREFECFDDPIIRAIDWSQNDIVMNREVKNTDRNIGTRLSSELLRRRKSDETRIRLELVGSAGQSMGTFLAEGVEIHLTGEANDYVGKGMAGGEIVIRPPDHLKTTGPVVAGNALLYGATAGKLFAAGKVAERFGVRNSGVSAVIEGCGDHGCEYMTRGTVLILGPIGNNFAAGMTGGDAFVWDPNHQVETLCNQETVTLSTPKPEHSAHLNTLVQDHFKKTGSLVAESILTNWDKFLEQTCWVRAKQPE